MNRAQRILHYVASCQSPASVSQIVDAVAKAETSIPDHAKYSVNVAAQLSEFAKNGKLERSGKYGAYRYTASPIALSDLRKTTRDGKVRNAAKLARAAKPRPLSRPAAAAPPLKAAARTTPQRLALANIGTPAPRKPGERETVEQFLARGGRVQKLPRRELPAGLRRRARGRPAIHAHPPAESPRHRTRQHHRRRRRRRLIWSTHVSHRIPRRPRFPRRRCRR
jgi:hypothetical protein